MRAANPIRLASAVIAAAGAVGCQYLPSFGSPPPALPASYVLDRGAEFSEERAWQHLVALTAIGPRVKGTDGAAAARTYIRAQLEAFGVNVQEQVVSAVPVDAAEDASTDAAAEDREAADGAEGVEGLRQIIATIPGPSEAFVILGAAYDTRPFESFEFVGANDGASGPAVLLELARALAARPLPYTTHVVFFEGEAPDGSNEEPELRFGSTAVAGRLERDGYTDHVRLVVILDRVCDADLTLARDLRSHRMYRNEFWKTANRMGLDHAFQPDGKFESVSGSHLSFIDAGMRRAVLLSDTSFGGDEPPGHHANSEDDKVEHCAAESLGIVGTVTLETIDTITRRLAKVDRVSPPRPLSSGDESADEAGEESGEGSGDDVAAEEAPDDPATAAGDAWDEEAAR